MDTKIFAQRVESGEATTLTVEAAKRLIGHTIWWSYFPADGNIMAVEQMTIGRIDTDSDGRLVIIDADGNNTSIMYDSKVDFFDEPTFTCSDPDRSVFFIAQ